jgi:histidine triad (HIT) family protein
MAHLAPRVEMPSIFTRIIQGQIPCEKILEDDAFIAFLDIRPINPGHTLVVPKSEIDELFDQSPDILGRALPFAQRVAKALKKSVPCRRVGIMVAGFEVPHAHIHLIPIAAEGELSFGRARPASPEDLAALGKRIRENL